MAKPIGTLGVIDTLTIGGRVFTDLTTLIILRTRNATAGTEGYGTFRAPNATAGYTVTASKTLTVVALECHSEVLTASMRFDLLYSDNDMGIASNTAPTNPVYAYGQVNTFIYSLTNLPEYYYPDFDVPAGKYIGIDSVVAGQALSYTLFGYEA